MELQMNKVMFFQLLAILKKKKKKKKRFSKHSRPQSFYCNKYDVKKIEHSLSSLLLFFYLLFFL